MPNDCIYDVVVVGAGPAGSTSARELCKSGFKVLIIDKNSFPRKKTCGGLIPVKALKELDFNIPGCYIKNNIYKLSIYSCNMENSTHESSEKMGITTLREEFDHHLLNRAIAQGAHFQGETCFEKLSREGSYLKIFTSKGIFNCKILVGCDGVFSKVKRYVENKQRAEFYKMGFALSTSIEGPKDWSDNEFKLFQLPVLFTMGWAIPCKDYINVGIGGPWVNRDKIINHFDRFIGKVSSGKMKKDDVITKGAFLPAGGFYRKIYNDGILLAGDAGGFADPLTGEGLYYAIRSGKIAARQIIQGELSSYESCCYKEFNPTLRSSLIKNLIGMNKIYSRSPKLRQRLCQSFSNTMYTQ